MQVASRHSQARAEEDVRALRRRGISAAVLRSDDYTELRAGWFVVYIGPYSVDAAGREKARLMQARVRGSIHRVVHSR